MHKPPKTRNSNEVNFYRVNDNFGYVKGNITFSDGCSNNLVVSDEPETTIDNLRNSLIITQRGNMNIYPIENFQESYERVISHLNGKAIKYNIPEKVFKRENLIRKSPENLERLLLDNYGFLLKDMVFF